MAVNSDYKQWLRQYRLIVAPQAGGTGYDVSELRFAFKVEKSMNDTPNYSVLSIVNPSTDFISSVRTGDSVTLEAGYIEGNFGLIFDGTVVQSYSSYQDGTDRVLNLVCEDGDMYLNMKFVATTLAKGASAADKIALLTAGTPTGIIGDSVKNLPANPRGVVYFGLAANYVERMSVASDSQAYVDDGKVNIVAANDYADGIAVELNPDTGLLDQPTQTDDGISAKCLLNPSIKLNTIVHIDSSWILEKQKTVPKQSSSGDSGEKSGKSSKSSDTGKIKETAPLAADGMYRIVTLTYEGDTHGDSWYCTFDAISQDGVNAAGAGGSPSSSNDRSSGSSSGGSNKRQSVIYQIFRGKER